MSVDASPRGEAPGRYRLVEASSDDESWLDGLRRRAYAELFDATWGCWDEARHRRHFAACLRRGAISLIEVDGTRIGMIQLVRHDDSIEVAEIQVDPAHQARGVGSRILRDVMADARKRDMPVRLSVGLSNARARRLYERLGFESVGRSDTHDHMRYVPR